MGNSNALQMMNRLQGGLALFAMPGFLFLNIPIFIACTYYCRTLASGKGHGIFKFFLCFNNVINSSDVLAAGRIHWIYNHRKMKNAIPKVIHCFRCIGISACLKRAKPFCNICSCWRGGIRCMSEDAVYRFCFCKFRHGIFMSY